MHALPEAACAELYQLSSTDLGTSSWAHPQPKLSRGRASMLGQSPPCRVSPPASAQRQDKDWPRALAREESPVLTVDTSH